MPFGGIVMEPAPKDKEDISERVVFTNSDFNVNIYEQEPWESSSRFLLQICAKGNGKRVIS